MTFEPLPPRYQVSRNWILGGLLACAVLTIITEAAPVAAPVFMAAFIASVLRSPVRVLNRWNVPRPLAAAMVFVASVGFAAFLFASLYEPAAEWVRDAPEVAEKIERKLYPIKKSIEEARDTAERIDKATDVSGENAAPVVIQEPSFMEELFAMSRILLAQVAVTLILSLLMLAFPQPLIPASLTDRFGERGRRFRLSLEEVERQMSRYMGTMVAINAAVGVLTATAMWLLGMPTPLLWGVLAAILGLVPFIGPLITAGLIGSAAFITFDAWTAMLAPVLAYLTINLIESELVTPMVVGRVLTLHPVAIFIAILVWSFILGFAGAFLAVPILVACAITFRNVVGDDHGARAVVAPDTSTEQA